MKRFNSSALSVVLLLACFMTPAQAGPLLWYEFEGNVSDSSGNGRHGTVSGSVGYAAGFSGQALSLDGSGWVVLPDDILRGNPRFTVTMRFKTSDSGALLGYQNQVAEALPFQYVPILAVVPDENPGSAGKLRGELWTTAGGLAVFSTGAVNDGAWHTVVVSATETSIVVYLDDVFLGQQVGAVDHLEMQYNQIGTAKLRLDAGDAFRRFTGLIDDLVITTEYLAEVTTQAVSAIGTTTATGNGNITSLGNPNPTQHGVCWSIAANPTIADNKTEEGAAGATGAFTSSITGLTADTTYHVRAYVINSAGTSYGEEVTFTTDTTPTVTTVAVSAVTTTTATSGGNVTTDGGEPVTGRGVCWNTAGAPTIGDGALADDSGGTGAFVSNITGLSPGTTYYIRAYATNSVGTAYGAQRSFTTASGIAAGGGSPAYTIGGGAVTIDSGLLVVGNTIDGCRVSVTDGFTAGDTLGYTGALPKEVFGSYNAATGILAFSGSASAAQWQTLLRTVTFTTTADNTASRTIAFTIGSAIPFGENGHFYEYVASPGIIWSNAKNAAEARNLFGMQGYLATITSQEENDFIRQKLGADAWIGGTDEVQEDIWRWATGPEAGTQFSTDNVPFGGQFSNWNEVEPNNCCGGEHYAEIYSTDGVGKWNDLSGAAGLAGYVAEYGGTEGDPSPEITANKTVNVSEAGGGGNGGGGTVDLCPEDPAKTAPGDCGCGVVDTDSDGDDFADCIDGCPSDPTKDRPGTQGCGVEEADGDGDGTPDSVDKCPDDPVKTVPGMAGCGENETDGDGDGSPDSVDLCPDDANKTEPGLEGCGVTETDSDGDGTPDSADKCPNDPNKASPGVYGCGADETDTDGDGTPDEADKCPDDPNKTAPGEQGCGTSEPDTDGDGMPDSIDICRDDPFKMVPGLYGCGVRETDTDGDGTIDDLDTCPNDPAKTQPGMMGCGVAEPDADGDGTPDGEDGCPDDPHKSLPGNLGCGVPEFPDLRITITADGNGGSDDSSDVNVGEEILVIVEVENIGDGGAHDVCVTVPLPPDTEFVSASYDLLGSGRGQPEGVTVLADRVILFVGDVPAGSQVKVDLLLKALQTGEVTLTAESWSSQDATPAVPDAPAELLVKSANYVRIVRSQPAGCGVLGVSPLVGLCLMLGLRQRRRGR